MRDDALTRIAMKRERSNRWSKHRCGTAVNFPKLIRPRFENGN